MHTLWRWILCCWLCLPLLAAQAETPRDAAAMTRRVDQLLNARLEQEKVAPVESASDAEFLRRATIDLTGRTPRVSDVRAFLADSRPDRRAIVIDALLAKPTHATHLAHTWRRSLLPDSADVTRFGGERVFETWLRQQFVDNRPYDRLARELLLAKGSADQGPALFYIALENKPEELAAATSRALLGVQIQCAQCHDHPHDKWKQDDFWGYAAFFARLQRLDNAVPGAAVMVVDNATGEVVHPERQMPVPPRFLASDTTIEDTMLTRREALAAWLTAKENPYFAKATVNRVWALLFGRGLVEPVDDLGDHNPPSHPELMQALADYFVATDYDVRGLMSVLANTDAYQRTSKLRPGETESKPELFARMAVKSLTAEQLYDSLQVATARRELPRTMMPDVGIPGLDPARAEFLDKFRSASGSAVEYQAGIPQSLTLMNGQLIAQATDVESSDLLRALQAPFMDDDQRIETLFLAVLSRPPHKAEQSKFTAYLESRLTDAERRSALSDMLWALLNTAEFTLNH